jgi:ABC-type glycerol-3-phosphate transport system substrate-binding protein
MKYLSLILIGLFLGSFLLFASGDKEEQAAKMEEVKMTIWAFGNPGKFAAQVNEDFQKENPNVTIELASMNPWQMFDKLFVTMMSGTGAPDIAVIVQRILDKYALSGKLADLDDLVRRYKESYDTEYLDSLNYNDKYYGFPLDLNISVLFYNDDMLQQNGIEATEMETWEDFVKVCQKLKSAGVEGLWLPKPCGSWGVMHYKMFIQSKGIQIFTKDGKVVTNNTPAKDTLKWWNDLYQYAFPAAVHSPELWDALNEEKVAFYVKNSSNASIIKSKAPDLAGKLRFMPWLAWEPGKQARTAQWAWSCWVVPAQSRNKDWAANWIEYANTSERAMGYLWSYGNMPAYAFKGKEIEAFRSTDDYYGGQNLYETITQLPFGTFYYRNWLQASEIIGEEFDLMLLGKQSPENAWDKIEQRLVSELQ